MPVDLVLGKAAIWLWIGARFGRVFVAKQRSGASSYNRAK